VPPDTGAMPPHSADAATGPYVAPAPSATVSSVPGYEIHGELGRGGMGVVYKARQTGLERIVALNMILAGAHAATADLDRFRTEALAVAQVRHPNIVQIYDIGDHNGLPFFSLEYCEGGEPGRPAAGRITAAERRRFVRVWPHSDNHAIAGYFQQNCSPGRSGRGLARSRLAM